MKLPAGAWGKWGRRGQREGYATVVTLALAVLMLVFVVSAHRTTDRLKREVRILEVRQVRHWQQLESGGMVRGGDVRSAVKGEGSR